MSNILLTGVPGSGKSDLIETSASMVKQLGKSVQTTDLSELVLDEAQRNWRTNDKTLPIIDYSYQQVLRSYATSEAARLLNESNADNQIVETPMSMFQNGIIPDTIFSREQVDKIDNAAPLDYVVTLIDDSQRIAEKQTGTPYPTDPDEVLRWIAYEVNSTANITPHKNSRGETVRKLVMPKNNSSPSLTKMLLDETPTVTYVGFPISHLKDGSTKANLSDSEKQKARERIDAFKESMQEYTIPIVPIVMEDERSGKEAARLNTTYRDRHWFVKNADFMVGYFPRDVHSTGVTEELRQAKRIGTTTVLIHPDGDDEEVFGIRPTLTYRHENEFFEAIRNSGKERYDTDPERALRGLLDDTRQIPRYSSLLRTIESRTI